jgi:DNA mismatch repair protein MutL
MAKISRLSTHLANMIAAGEVVERPSSVVKELVENAIDANAKNITIELKLGGLDEIKIIDDGEGMDSEDVLLAFQPHATSKIKTEYDLARILSLGFRGEAIASIAAVSNMQIISSQDGINGYQVTYEAGSKKGEGVIHSNKGTTVIVKNLFFNTPARLKYLKPEKNELAAITFLMDRIALAHPDIRFRVINNDRIHLQTSASNKSINLMGEIYGLEVAKNLIETDFAVDGVNAKMILVKPEVYRSNKLEITLIVNGRYVKNYNITNAVIDGYSTLIPIGKYPIAVLYLEIDPLLVDVNVHPSKTEIKISNEEYLVTEITNQIKDSLQSKILIPKKEFSQPKPKGYQVTSLFDTPVSNFEEPKTTYKNILEEFRSVNVDTEETKEFVIAPEVKEQILKVEEPVIEEKVEVVDKLPYFEYVGQVFGTYLVFQNDKEMFLMDQHAAAERINYEKYYEILGEANQPTTEMLLPIMISFTKSEILFLEEHMEDFNRLGFVLEPMSNQDYVIRQIPLWANIDNAYDVIRKVFDLIINSKKVDIIYFRDAIAKQISCKSSIKANKALNNDEITTLVNNLRKCKNPYTCPHGRPTIISFKQTELEKMFERIQS